MSKNYDPIAIEKLAIQKWQDNKLSSPAGDNAPYCIMLPPPNITGSLHMGHGFQLTLMDILIRQQRMLGKKTLWQPGTDHAGIATQMVVERQLAAKGIKNLTREELLEHIWEWKNLSGNKIEEQVSRIGASVDWERKKFTLDDTISKAVKHVFISLYDQQLIYKAKKLTNWDCKLQTAVSDLEVTHTTKNASLWHINYQVKGTKELLTIATTRPETLLGDAAIAVNPKDIRYKHLIGKSAIVPISQREVPIIADENVDIDFGTGCLKITPAHDFNDNMIGKKHNLPLHNILNQDGTLNDFVPKKYQGLDRFIARKAIVEDLTASGELAKIEPYTTTVPIGDRSGTILEPMLTNQWFISMEKLAQPAIEQVRNNNIKFVPKNWENTYFKWLESIEDWCISRQLVWGHRIPAWYDAEKNIYVGESIEDVRQKYNLSKNIELTQDNDVLDTWFSSALWPFATLGWPENTLDYNTFFPTQVLVTGFDIIFFWVARMIMMSLHFTNQIPFETVYITGLIRDHNGDKMSKSKGNVIDPIDLIEGISLDDLIAKRTAGLMQPEMQEKIIANTKKEYPDGISAAGTDAVRFTFCALASTGRDIIFDYQRLNGYRNFCNKLWNACRYLEMTLKPMQATTVKHFINQWMLSELNSLIANTNQHLQAYRFDLLAKDIYEFTWNEYCDWYLEWTKTLLQAKDPKIINETNFVLAHTMSSILRILHPIIPFITDKLWTDNPLISNNIEIHKALWPNFDASQLNQEACDKVIIFKEIINAVRNIRSELTISPNKKIEAIFIAKNKEIKSLIEANSSILKELTKIDTISWQEQHSEEDIAGTATAVVKNLTILVPLQGLIDIEAEIDRIEKSILKTKKLLIPLQQRLENQQYMNKAPKHIVAQVQHDAHVLTDKINKLTTKLAQITSTT
jgi:valyl-tRNA synthetase